MQFPSQSVKKCAQCQTPAPIESALCEQCGRVFPIQSAEALLPPRNYAPAPRAGQGKRVFVGFCFLFVILASGAGIYAWQSAEHEPQALPATRSSAGSPPTAASPSNASAIPNKGSAPNAGSLPKSGAISRNVDAGKSLSKMTPTRSFTTQNPSN